MLQQAACLAEESERIAQRDGEQLTERLYVAEGPAQTNKVRERCAVDAVGGKNLGGGRHTRSSPRAHRVHRHRIDVFVLQGLGV